MCKILLTGYPSSACCHHRVHWLCGM